MEQAVSMDQGHLKVSNFTTTKDLKDLERFERFEKIWGRILTFDISISTEHMAWSKQTPFGVRS
jgi:hypothetical protein